MKILQSNFFSFYFFISISIKLFLYLSNYRLISKLNSLKGRKISLTGQFDYTKEILLGPRSAPGLATEKAQGMATNPQGYFVITPLYLNNG